MCHLHNHISFIKIIKSAGESFQHDRRKNNNWIRNHFTVMLKNTFISCSLVVCKQENVDVCGKVIIFFSVLLRCVNIVLVLVYPEERKTETYSPGIINEGGTLNGISRSHKMH